MRQRIQPIIVMTLTLLLPQAAVAQDSADLKSELGELQEEVADQRRAAISNHIEDELV